MANPKSTPADAPDARSGEASSDIKAILLETLKSLSPAELADVLRGAGAVPTTQGLTPDVLQSIVQAFQATSQTAVRETLRQERKENPNYPAKSVFHPAGVFDDSGKTLTPKATFRRTTYFQGVRLGGELETEQEIELCNAFTTDRDAREGRWTARLENKGRPNEKLLITIPSKTVDDRMENSLPLALILRELLDGVDAVNPDALQRQIDEMKQTIAKLQAAAAAPVV